jgi:hypothetical protein
MDFTQSEVETIQKHVDDRWREKDHGVHLGDIEIDGEEQAAAVWEHKHYTFIVVKVAAFKYRALFYFLRDKRFDAGVDEYNDLDECVDSIMKAQADFSLSKSTNVLKPKKDK